VKFTRSFIGGVYYWEPDLHQDNRGYFYRGFCRDELKAQGIEVGDIVQMNHSFNKVKGTFRGLHYQIPPFAEEKIITCMQGDVLDLVLDLRKRSPTFLKYEVIGLSEVTHRSVLVPKGCAHGFITLKENCQLLYLHTAFYKPEYERAVSVSDPRVNITLPVRIEEMSERDKNHPLLSNDFQGIEL